MNACAMTGRHSANPATRTIAALLKPQNHHLPAKTQKAAWPAIT
jgi:hypothetical protein